MSAPSTPEFEPGSEQFLAAVLYVARDAQREWGDHRGFRGSRWWYLNRVRRQLGIKETVSVPYSVMREELIRFAEQFGVVGFVPSTEATHKAVSTFDDIEKENTT